MSGRNVSVTSSWKLLASTTCTTSAVVSVHLAGWRPARDCRPTSASTPAGLAASAPTSVVVVDLPLVPVIAIDRPSSQREASSSSPMIGTPAPRGSSNSGCHGGTPGTQHDQVRAAQRRGPVPAQLQRDARRLEASRASSIARATLGQHDARAPRARAATGRRAERRCAPRRPPTTRRARPPRTRSPRRPDRPLRSAHPSVTAASASSG